MADDDRPRFAYASTIRVAFPNADQALFVKRALEVDEDLRLDRSRRIYSLDAGDNILQIRTEATSLRFLRVSVDSMLELLTLAVNTVGEFWPTRRRISAAASQ